MIGLYDFIQHLAVIANFAVLGDAGDANDRFGKRYCWHCEEMTRYILSDVGEVETEGPFAGWRPITAPDPDGKWTCLRCGGTNDPNNQETYHVSEDNDWGFGSGLSLEDCDVEINALRFEVDNSIEAGTVVAVVEFLDLDEGATEEQRLSVGKGWVVDRSGEFISPEGLRDGAKDKRKINDNSNFGILGMSARDLVEDPNEINPIVWTEHGGHSVRRAEFWLGTRWHLGTRKIERMNPSTKEKFERPVYIFTEFLGDASSEPVDRGDAVAAEPQNAPPAAAKSAAAPRKAAATGGTRVGGGRAAAKPTLPDGVDQELYDTLVELARGAVANETLEGDAKYEAFLDAALALEGVQGNRKANQAVMNTGKGSIWAAAGGETI